MKLSNKIILVFLLFSFISCVNNKDESQTINELDQFKFLNDSIATYDPETEGIERFLEVENEYGNQKNTSSKFQNFSSSKNAEKPKMAFGSSIANKIEIKDYHYPPLMKILKLFKRKKTKDKKIFMTSEDIILKEGNNKTETTRNIYFDSQKRIKKIKEYFRNTYNFNNANIKSISDLNHENLYYFYNSKGLLSKTVYENKKPGFIDLKISYTRYNKYNSIIQTKNEKFRSFKQQSPDTRWWDIYETDENGNIKASCTSNFNFSTKKRDSILNCNHKYKYDENNNCVYKRMTTTDYTKIDSLTYNESNKLIKQSTIRIKSNGLRDLDERLIYSYNDHGDLEEIKTYIVHNYKFILRRIKKISYSYDYYGNWIRKTTKNVIKYETYDKITSYETNNRFIRYL